MIVRSFYSFPMLILALVSARAQGGTYLYQNCSDQGRGVPLVDCSSAEIDQELGRVRINNLLESAVPISSSGRMKYLGSDVIPIAIPEDYSSVSSWNFKNRRYLKVKASFDSGIFDGKVDVIVALDELDEKADKRKGEVISLDDPRARPIFSFWYSARRGVLAIGIPKVGDSGDVYYCISKSCLFGAEHSAP